MEGSEEEDHLLPSNEEDNYNEDFEDDDSKSDMEADGQRNGGSELVSLYLPSRFKLRQKITLRITATCSTVRGICRPVDQNIQSGFLVLIIGLQSFLFVIA